MKLNKKISAEEAKERFDKQRNDIVLCVDEYYGWVKQSLFYDLIVEDYFWAIPRNVYFKQSTPHPKRKAEKTKQTCLKKWGVKNVSQNTAVIEKKKQTCLENWGVECSLHNDEVKQDIRNNWLEKYGTYTPQSNLDIKKKIKETNLKRYGVENPFSSEEVNDKIRQTCLKKYGVEYYAESSAFKYKVSDRIIIDTGEHLYDWYEKKSEPKPPIDYLRKNIDTRIFGAGIRRYAINRQIWE